MATGRPRRAPHPRAVAPGKRGAVVTHLPMRPKWDCDTCGQGWPCDPAREALAAETGGGTALAILMWTYLEDFALDTDPGCPLTGAFERFISWTRSAGGC